MQIWLFRMLLRLRIDSGTDLVFLHQVPWATKNHVALTHCQLAVGTVSFCYLLFWPRSNEPKSLQFCGIWVSDVVNRSAVSPRTSLRLWEKGCAVFMGISFSSCVHVEYHQRKTYLAKCTQGWVTNKLGL